MRLLYVLCVIRYTMRRCVSLCRFLFPTLWLSYGRAVGMLWLVIFCDALLRLVTFLCGTISHARRWFYGAFMSFLKGVFRFGLVWGVKSLLTTVASSEGLW